ncbi:twin transmembrane helix small protein [Limnohabitans sp. Rim47]|uniref:twin transmembrane helix small protein n=1 Tax=Limnohabitans sp. Rim47 TaxID=1100721 RepID=UPI0002E7ED4D|nr:twin transmembrane helix small protein [Limnohabitans sp. Rim47]
MKILVAIAFVAILASLVWALVHMMRGRPASPEEQLPKKNNMATALAFRVGFSIVLFICVLISWKMGWIQPTGIPPGA